MRAVLIIMSGIALLITLIWVIINIFKPDEKDIEAKEDYDLKKAEEAAKPRTFICPNCGHEVTCTTSDDDLPCCEKCSSGVIIVEMHPKPAPRVRLFRFFRK